MTYRERRERRAERLREFAAKRQHDAGGELATIRERYAGDHAFNFQPGHIPERARVIRRQDRLFESLGKADDMASRASGIEAQLATAIYDDDPDAIERLEAKLAKLEQRRDAIKAKRTALRTEHREALKDMTAYEREEVMRAGGAPQYEVTNLGGQISRIRERLERLKREAEHGPTDRLIYARFDSECAACGDPLTKGDLIRYNRQDGARCRTCPTEEE